MPNESTEHNEIAMELKNIMHNACHKSTVLDYDEAVAIFYASEIADWIVEKFIKES